MPEENETTEETTEGQEPQEVTEETKSTETEGGEETTDLTEDDFDSLPEKTRKEIRRLRSEVAKARTSAKQQAAEEARAAAEAEAKTKLDAVQAERDAQLKEIAKLLGLSKDETSELTPEQVIEQITAERDAAREREQERDKRFRELALEVAVQDAANMHGAVAERLLDSRKFMKTVTGLDPDSEGFRVAVADAVKEFADTDETVRATKKKVESTPVSGGTTVAGTKPKRFEDMSVDEMRKALRGGQ